MATRKRVWILVDGKSDGGGRGFNMSEVGLWNADPPSSHRVSTPGTCLGEGTLPQSLEEGDTKMGGAIQALASGFTWVGEEGQLGREGQHFIFELSIHITWN